MKVKKQEPRYKLEVSKKDFLLISKALEAAAESSKLTVEEQMKVKSLPGYPYRAIVVYERERGE